MLATTAVSPLSSVMFARAEAMDNAYLKSGGGPLALTGGQLWLRQSDHALSPQGVAIIHAHGVELHGKRLTASQVSVFRLDGRDRLLSRIEAGEATLGAGAWQLQNARVIRPEQMPEPSGHDQSADRPYRGTRAGKLRLARYAVVLDACPTSSRCSTARDFRRSATGCIFRRCSPCRCSARHHGAGRRRILHASGATRRRGTDDRQRRRGRIRIVPGLQDRRGIRPVRARCRSHLPPGRRRSPA